MRTKKKPSKITKRNKNRTSYKEEEEEEEPNKIQL